MMPAAASIALCRPAAAELHSLCCLLPLLSLISLGLQCLPACSLVFLLAFLCSLHFCVRPAGGQCTTSWPFYASLFSLSDVPPPTPTHPQPPPPPLPCRWVVHGELAIGLFTLQDIPAGTELTFDYNFERYGDKVGALLHGDESSREMGCSLGGMDGCLLTLKRPGRWVAVMRWQG